MNSTILICKGRVQGVSFRYMIQKKASQINLKGYVKNLPDTSVEILAQGKNIAELKRFIRSSPGLSNVSDVIEKQVEYPELNSFKIRY